jgi:hypothetical protein
VPDELDLRRLAQLPQELGLELSEILETLIAELDRAIGDARTALEAGDLDTVADAAHAGRNSALMIDARPLMEALGELERDAAAGAPSAAASLERVAASWPELRGELARAAVR